MSPPPVVILIIRPAIGIVEAEKGAVRAVRGHIGPLFIPLLVFVNPLSVQPLIKGTTVIEHTV